MINFSKQESMLLKAVVDVVEQGVDEVVLGDVRQAVAEADPSLEGENWDAIQASGYAKLSEFLGGEQVKT